MSPEFAGGRRINVLWNLGQIYLARGEAKRADEAFQESVKALGSLPVEERQGYLYVIEQYTEMLRSQGRQAEAEAWEQALDTAGQDGPGQRRGCGQR